MRRKASSWLYGSTANLFTNRNGDYIGYGPEAHELVGIPDPETFVQLGTKELQEFSVLVLETGEEENDPGVAIS